MAVCTHDRGEELWLYLSSWRRHRVTRRRDGRGAASKETEMYKATIENWGDSRFLATTRHGSFALDTKGKASNPVDTFLAGMLGCMGHYVRDYLNEKSIPAPRFSITADATATADQSRLAEVTVLIGLGGPRLTDAQEQEFIAYVERCKLHGTLRQACPVRIVVQRQE
jgi:uncharacterized OsmC-like protein